MTRLTQDEREAKVRRIEALRKHISKLEHEKETLTAELLADSKLDEKERAGTLTYEFVNVVNWRSFDTEAAAKRLSIEDFPQIYEPTYKGTKKLIEQLGDESPVTMDDLCEKSPRLYIHSTKTAQRFIRKGRR